MEIVMRPPPSPFSWADALRAARAGPNGEALGRLLEGCRAYLLHIARQEWPAGLKAKENPSDLVQQTLLEAHKDFNQFQDSSEAGWRAWLRQLLLNNLQNLRKHYRRGRRDVSKEEVDRDGSGPDLWDQLAAPDPTPGACIQAQELKDRLDEALTGLKGDYREVIRLRHEQGLGFDEIGRRIDRSADAAQMLWVRAVLALKKRLGGLR